MRLLTILCLVLLSVHSYSQDVVTGPFLIRDGIYYHQDTNEPVTGIAQTFYYNGQLENRTNFKDGKPDGLRERFYQNGQLRLRGNYKDGELDGLIETFHENGRVEIRQNYKDGELEGLTERFWNHGQLSAFYHHGFWQPMDTLREKNLLENLWTAGKAPWKSW